MNTKEVKVIEEDIKRFFRSNKDSSLTVEEVKDVYLNNPKTLHIVDPDGNIKSYTLLPSEHHYVAYLDYAKNLINEGKINDSKISNLFKIDFSNHKEVGVAAARKVSNFLAAQNYYDIRGYMNPDTLNYHYLSNVINEPDINQKIKISAVHDHLGLSDYTIQEQQNNFIFCYKDLKDQKTK